MVKHPNRLYPSVYALQCLTGKEDKDIDKISLYSSLRQGMDVGDPEGVHTGLYTEVGVAQIFGGCKMA